MPQQMPEGPRRSTLSERLLTPTRTREAYLAGIVVVAALLISIPYGTFLSASNISEIIVDSSIIIIVSASQAMIVLTKQIDLSVGSVMGLSCMIVGVTAANHPGVPAIVLVLEGAGLGALFGLVNASIIAGLQLPSMIVTLATLEIYRGVVPAIASSVFTYQLPNSVLALARGSILGIPRLEFYALVVVILVGYFISQTRTGRELYAIGSNPDAAALTGIPARKRTFWLFITSGTVAGIAGVLWLAFYGAAETTSALGFEFTTVTVVVIGGMNIWGGSGSIRGVILGALILTGVTNALVIANVSVNWQQAVNGTILLVAVSGNVMLTKRTARRLMLAQRAREKQIAAVS